jgi:phosphatidylglycerophosphate synthase
MPASLPPTISPRATVRVKARDLCWTVFVIDPIAVPVVARIRKWTWVTADRLTALSTLLALAAAALFATQRFAWGGAVYQLSFLFDCLDGKVASARAATHGWGGWFDQASDAVRMSACSAGLGAGLVAAGFDRPWQVAALILYPSLRWTTTALVGIPRPEPTPRAAARTAPPTHIDVLARPWQVFKAAFSRRLKPGSTVDTEAVAFTIGPILTVPFVGVLVATALDLLHATYMLAGSLRDARRSRAPAAAD